MSRLGRSFLLLLLLVAAWLIRLYDLDDPPLDFHPTRQLFSALKARGIYYAAHPALLPEWKLRFALQQRQKLATIEPEIMEHLVAWTYQFTGEALWVARLYSSLFWVAGGYFLWDLARRRFSTTAAFLSLATYLFLPYAVIASRSFQPDPLMVALMIAFWWGFDRWQESPSLMHTLLAGLLGGLAILVKFPALFFVYPLLTGWLAKEKQRRSWGQAIGLSLLIAMPAALYLVYGLREGFLAQQFGGRFFPQLWLVPSTYLQWMQEAHRAAGMWLLVAALLGLLILLSSQAKTYLPLLLSLWAGYLLYGFAFPHHIATHDYYHLPLIPLAALSAAPLFDLLTSALSAHLSGRLARPLLGWVLLYAFFGTLWGLRAQLKAVDYRPQAAMWAEIGEKLEHKPAVVALTPDYGLSLAYWGWQSAQLWPSSADLNYQSKHNSAQALQELFERLTAGKRYFLIADPMDFQRQPWLQTFLQPYPIFAEGPGYRIYSLQP
ncbi:MAG: ArnT family glycosyltransferase [Anaerolineales bacterium]